MSYDACHTSRRELCLVPEQRTTRCTLLGTETQDLPTGSCMSCSPKLNTERFVKSVGQRLAPHSLCSPLYVGPTEHLGVSRMNTCQHYDDGDVVCNDVRKHPSLSLRLTSLKEGKYYLVIEKANTYLQQMRDFVCGRVCMCKP